MLAPFRLPTSRIPKRSSVYCGKPPKTTFCTS
jgi:hypothetical protein